MMNSAPSTRATPLRRSPTQGRSEERIELILRATAKLISQGPPETVTTTQIAKAANISVASIYRYFADVDRVFEALIRRSESELLERIRVGGLTLVGDDWREAVSNALDIQVEFLRDLDTGFHALWFGASGALAAKTMRSNRATDDVLAEQLIAELHPAKLEQLGAHPMVVVKLAIGILTKGTELAFTSTDTMGDPTVIEETKKAAIGYLSVYLG